MGGTSSRIFRIVFVAVVILSSLPAFGQMDLLDRDRDPALEGRQRVLADLDNASLRYGRVYLLSRFDISDVAVEPEFVQGSTDTRLSLVGSMPSRIYWVPRKKLAISADVTPSLGVVSDDGSLTTQWGYATRADLHVLTNSLYVDVYGATSDELTPLPAEVSGVGTARRRQFGSDAEFKYSSKTSLLATATRTTVRYPEERLQFVPEDFALAQYAFDEDRYRATFLHKTLPRVSTSLSAEWRKYDFPDAQYASADRSEYAFGATYKRRRQVYRFQAGPGKVTFNNPVFRDFDGILGSVSANVAMGRRWNFVANLSRDVGFSAHPLNGYYKITGGGATAQFTASRRLSFHVTPAVWRHNYDTPVNGILRRDRIRQVLVGWTYTLPLLRFGFDVGDYAYSSNAGLVDDSGIRLILRLSFSASRWFR